MAWSQQSGLCSVGQFVSAADDFIWLTQAFAASWYLSWGWRSKDGLTYMPRLSWDDWRDWRWPGPHSLHEDYYLQGSYQVLLYRESQETGKARKDQAQNLRNIPFSAFSLVKQVTSPAQIRHGRELQKGKFSTFGSQYYIRSLKAWNWSGTL